MVETHSPPARLIRSTDGDDGAPSSDRLVRALRAGEVLRLRRGIYVRTSDWLDAEPWTRYDYVVAAVALRTPSPLFCRQSALLLHGLPLPTTPDRVHVRVGGRGSAGTRRAPVMTEGTAAQRRLAAEAMPAGGSVDLRRLLRPTPTHQLEAAQPAGIDRASLRELVASGEHHQPCLVLLGDALASVVGPASYLVEPMNLALVDTVSRVDFPSGVALLDAALTRDDLDVEAWLEHLPTVRRRRIWQRAWDFADPASESVGESISRAQIHALGFEAPTLQRVITTNIGTFRVDFCWEQAGVICEFDGRIKYLDVDLRGDTTPAQQVYAEKQREDALRRHGWGFGRWGWTEAWNPRLLAARLENLGVPRTREVSRPRPVVMPLQGRDNRART